MSVDTSKPRGILRTTEQRKADEAAGFHIAWERRVDEPCEHGTVGCCVAFHDEHDGCEVDERCDVCGEQATHQETVFSPGGSELMFYCVAHKGESATEVDE